MRIESRYLGSWGRRSILLVSLWYLILVSSTFLYLTYARWRPAILHGSVLDAAVTGSSSVLLKSRDLTPVRWRTAELRRILVENPSLSPGRNTVQSIQPGGDDTAAALALAADLHDQHLLIYDGVSRKGIPKKSNSLPLTGDATNRTRNRPVAWDYLHPRVANGMHGDAVHEVEMEEVGEDLRDRYMNTVGTTTVGFDNATAKTPLPPVVDGYERVGTGEGLRLRCAQCAVVSSSGHLINNSRGREIDSAQCVMRMNSAPTYGYEDDVGARTTIRVVGHVNMAVLNSSRQLQEQIFINQTSRAEKIIIPWLHTFKGNKENSKYYNIATNFSKAFPNVEFYILTPEKAKLADELFKLETGLTTQEANTWLSTGWMTLLFAIDVCDEIDIYGLVDERYCRDHPNDTTPYHYYDPTGKVECKYYQRSEERLSSGHLFITEKAVFARWAHKFNFSFHTPAWNLTAAVPAGNSSLAQLETPFLKRFYEAKRNNKTTVVRRRKVVKRVVRKVVVKRKVPVVVGKVDVSKAHGNKSRTGEERT